MKRNVTIYSEGDGAYTLEGLDRAELIAKLGALMPENGGKGYSLDFYEEYDTPYFRVVQTREETDEEYERRLKTEASFEARNKQRELALLAALKVKYEQT